MTELAPPPDGFDYVTYGVGNYVVANGDYIIVAIAPVVVPVLAFADGDGAGSAPAKRPPRLQSLGGIVGRDIPVAQPAIEKVRAAQKAVRQAVKATVKKKDAPKALEKAADAILDVQDAIPHTDWESLWRAYLKAQTAHQHEARVKAYARAEMQAQAMLRRAQDDQRLRAEQDDEMAILALLLAA